MLLLAWAVAYVHKEAVRHLFHFVARCGHGSYFGPTDVRPRNPTLRLFADDWAVRRHRCARPWLCYTASV